MAEPTKLPVNTDKATAPSVQGWRPFESLRREIERFPFVPADEARLEQLRTTENAADIAATLDANIQRRTQEPEFGLASIVTVRDAFYENAEQGLAAAYSSARFSFVVALVGLLAVIAGSAGLIVMVRRRILNPIAALTGRMSRLAAGEVAEAIPGAARNDEIGAMAAAVQVFKDNKIEADRLATEKEAENDVKMRRARALDDLTRAFEAKVTELVGGLSAASSVMEDTAQSMSATASATNRQAAVVAAASDQTSTNVQTVASATEELTSSISEIARQVATSTEIAARAVDHARRTGDTARSLDRKSVV